MPPLSSVKYLSALFLVLTITLQTTRAQTTDNVISYTLEENIPYATGDDLIAEYCKLDAFYPNDRSDLPVLVYFHGGGLKGGTKNIPEYFKEKEIIVFTVNYRLYPQVATREILDDAAKAVKWAFDHAEDYGGSTEKIFLSGHSAGGYITSMLGLDSTYLEKYDLHPDMIAGLIPLSGHTITHMTVREEMGIPETRPVVDAMAPLYHVKKETPPYIMITGDRELELLGRYEENAYMLRMMKLVGNTNSELFELQGYGHDMVYPAAPIVVKKIKEICSGLK
ncbi:alpha/beta hydrolase [Robertkochia sediminum]|uniref:alpha/beta hydrolase n=1 Tax=Robertkochia sediminum TaxID=2785326 RepID=UPI001933A29C|nr:alpha/beta hydrolase [Robertkochia sediminum]MBL7471232.1 alpha/beta hydrolase [Robertkochia sediminum]